MTFNGWVQIALYALLVTACVKPLGLYMVRVYAGERTFLSPLLKPLEATIYRLCRVEPAKEQHWTNYTVSLLVFSAAAFLFTYLTQRLQQFLPLDPQHLGAVSPDSSFNTAVSFSSNTNWQDYGGETTMSYLTQMAALTVQNFVSAAAGMALAIALIRGFARTSAKTVGNFWADLVRGVLYMLLPLSLVMALVLVWLGVPQNLDPYTHATTLEGAKQIIAQGPAASQIAIKQLGTNGGGFFNVNSAHPFENPNAITNLIEMWAILVISAALTYTFGVMVKNTRQGWALFAVMGILFLGGVSATYWAESYPSAAIAAAHVDAKSGPLQAGGNMEGKEVRFGIANSAIWAAATTDASNGSVNSMHDSYTPLGGLVELVNIQLGEIVFGGVGSGLYGMLLFAIVAVFIAGLMVGRTPEYLGKKIEGREVKMAMLAILILPLSILGFTALAVVLPQGLSSLANAGPHGFSEILYAYTSGTGNNGSAFAGLNANTPFYNATIGFAMLIGRFLFIVPMMAVAGSLAGKKIVPASSGTFPTTGPLWVGLLLGVILIVGGLTFFPALSLGPIAEHLAMLAGQQF
ncbi:MAG: potassium-transporting ATPase subunit KdpA [Alphaproteobacteria bacterium]|nr:potassium-transporting ATPase subunit KdpA [Alphaproteobacteria bacterium]MDE2012544.1 potassium-transporting ATPase subunit KdpA [Alphaproteobacteria bacterium]MDE2072925.1 potassium-transporting ATPase subunit KdpA [Alphaproteobacteria bacterium]